MVNAYYRFDNNDRLWNAMYSISQLEERGGLKKVLSEEDIDIGEKIYYYLLAKCKQYGHEDREYIDNLEAYYDKDMEFEVMDNLSNPVRCRLSFTKPDIFQAYENASHKFFEIYKNVTSVELKKLGEKDFRKSEELTRLFEDLIFSAGANIGDIFMGEDEEEEKYRAYEMTPEICDLELIMRGISPKKAHEEMIENAKKEREARRKAKEKEDEEKRLLVESEKEDAMVEFYEKKNRYSMFFKRS